MKYLPLLLALCSPTLYAGTIGLIGPVYHFTYDKTQTNRVYGVYYQTSSLYSVGYYSNSYKNKSIFIAKTLPIYRNLSISIGVANGYYKDIKARSGLLPVAVLSVKVYKNIALSISPYYVGITYELNLFK